MFSFHRPKTYRSPQGCCICRAKSSSSRFTDSRRYEEYFGKCFRINEIRSGEICNACVLLVKRWQKLPNGALKHWHHVVDARAGPGSKSTIKKNSSNDDVYPKKYVRPAKLKAKQKISPAIYTYSPKSANSFNKYAYDDGAERNSACPSPCPSDISDQSNSSAANESQINNFSSFVDLKYWKKTQICCGVIFKGQNGEIMIDQALYRPCNGHRRKTADNPMTSCTTIETVDEPKEQLTYDIVKPMPPVQRFPQERSERYELPIDLSFKHQPAVIEQHYQPMKLSVM